MAPLSILPGRIRFENHSLIGSHDSCLQLERLLSSWSEVQAVTANPRTGRLLIRFDEKAISRDDLTARIETYLTAAEQFRLPAVPAVTGSQPSHAGQSPRPAHPSRHLLRDMVVHAVLPAPLDLLLPTALAVLRK